jgi:hypothetical protein
MANPASRGPAYGVQFFAILIMVGMGLVGAVQAVF